MVTLPLSEVKSRLSEIGDEVYRTHERVNVTKNGRDYLVLMSAEDLESIEATLELLADPTAMAEVAQAQADYAAGRFITGPEMQILMDERRARESKTDVPPSAV